MTAILKYIKPNEYATNTLKERVLSKRLNDVLMRLDALALETPQSNNIDREPCKVMIPMGNGSRSILINDIAYCVAEGSYSKIFLTDGSTAVLAKTLKKLSESLSSPLFIRCHQSYLVNASHIIEMINGVCRIRERDGFKDIPVSRRKIKEIKSCFIYL